MLCALGGVCGVFALTLIMGQVIIIKNNVVCLLNSNLYCFLRFNKDRACMPDRLPEVTNVILV